jgi:hypothetical protein
MHRWYFKTPIICREFRREFRNINRRMQDASRDVPLARLYPDYGFVAGFYSCFVPLARLYPGYGFAAGFYSCFMPLARPYPGYGFAVRVLFLFCATGTSLPRLRFCDRVLFLFLFEWAAFLACPFFCLGAFVL